MIHTSAPISIINANVIMHRNIIKNKKEKKNKNLNDKDVFLQEMFEQSWEQQEQRLSDLEINLRSKSGDSYCIEKVYEYKNGQKAKYLEISYPDIDPNVHVERWDENGNCIQVNSRFRSTFYPNSAQKEFEFLDGKVKHFDKDGNEDTKSYYLKKKIATKRLKEEEKSNVTLEKASKIEKAISVLMVDKPEMTLIEKMLMKKAKKR